MSMAINLAKIEFIPHSPYCPVLHCPIFKTPTFGTQILPYDKKARLFFQDSVRVHFIIRYYDTSMARLKRAYAEHIGADVQQGK
jgi:hypothetical protein